MTLALRTGMRQGELAAPRWEDLDLYGPRPSVRVVRSADTRTRTVVTPTKTGEERTVRLGPCTVETKLTPTDANTTQFPPIIIDGAGGADRLFFRHIST